MRAALDGLDADLVVLDCPNRQGGPLILNALTAADSVVYAAKLDEDGLDGVRRGGHHRSAVPRDRARIGLPPSVHEAGIVVGAVRETVMTRNARRALAELREGYPALVLEPFVPNRVIVGEAHAAHEFYGRYDKGRAAHCAYQASRER